VKRFYSSVLCALALAATTLAAKDTGYLPPDQPDAAELLAPPPLAHSMEQDADLAEVRVVSRSASKADTAEAMSEKSFSIFTFAPAIGTFFQPGRFPQTEQLFKRVFQDAEAATDHAKKHFQRPRPYTVDPSLLAVGKPEKSFSYPSGHSTESMVLALVLADLFPSHRDSILSKARMIGWHRVEIARHYPTDIYAGRVFAQAIVRELKKNPDFLRDFAAAKAEVDSAQQASRN
jgi:acid phosphatase (class A)